MDYKLYKKEEFHTSKWSGGTTKELAIFPQGADYLSRDFIWRLSSAIIDDEESTFTRLPDYDRILMVLEGDVVLSYEGERVARLKTLEQDRFDGGSKTKSFGKITDYNLMMRKGGQAVLDVLTLSEEKQDAVLDAHGTFARITQTFYCHEGYGVVSWGAETCMVKEGEQLVINYDPAEELRIGVMGEGILIRGQMFYNDMVLAAEYIQPERATFEDFKEAAKMSLTNFRGSKFLFKYLREIWYDEEIQRKVRKLERAYIPMLLWFVGLAVITGVTVEIWSAERLFAALGIWSLLMIFLISPLLYFIVLPKPVKAHIKRLESLTEYEKEVYAREQDANPTAERILKKYKITARNVYLPDKPKKKKK